MDKVTLHDITKGMNFAEANEWMSSIVGSQYIVEVNQSAFDLDNPGNCNEVGNAEFYLVSIRDEYTIHVQLDFHPTSTSNVLIEVGMISDIKDGVKIPNPCTELIKDLTQLERIHVNLISKGYTGTLEWFDGGVEYNYDISEFIMGADLEKFKALLKDFSEAVGD